MCCVYICDSVSRRRRNPMWTCVLSRLFAEVDGTIVIMSLLPEGVLCVGEDVENKSARCVWCTRVHDQQSRVSYRCKACKEFFCRGAKSNKRQCFELHKIHGVPPRNCRDPKKCGDYEKWRDIAAKDTAALKRSRQSEGNKAAAKRLKKKKG